MTFNDFLKRNMNEAAKVKLNKVRVQTDASMKDYVKMQSQELARIYSNKIETAQSDIQDEIEESLTRGANIRNVTDLLRGVEDRFERCVAYFAPVVSAQNTADREMFESVREDFEDTLDELERKGY